MYFLRLLDIFFHLLYLNISIYIRQTYLYRCIKTIIGFYNVPNTDTDYIRFLTIVIYVTISIHKFVIDKGSLSSLLIIVYMYLLSGV